MTTNKHVKAYIFDVDGVLTEPRTKKIEIQEILDELIKRLKRGAPVGLNTGRSLDFIIKEVLDPFNAKITDKKLLQNIIAIGEKGAVWITYDNNGNSSTQIDKNISIPHAFKSKIKMLIKHQAYTATMFYDDTKHTMASIEELPIDRIIGHHEDFKKAQKELVKDLLELIAKHNLQDKLKVDPTRIATDVENKHVGKALGVRKFIEILQNRGIKPKKYICFGDSASDFEMYEELLRLEKDAKFVFVGGRDHLAGKVTKDVFFTEQHIDKGTLEFLQKEDVQ